MGTEWTAEQYNKFYAVSTEYKKPYRDSIYWPIWQEVLRRVPKNAVVLELGCGTGQFADALRDHGIVGYYGIDFSTAALTIAMDKGHEVYEINAATAPWLSWDYDYLVCLETLEHIEDDIGVLNRIRPGKHCLITVPSYDGPNHVRHFPGTASVDLRYGNFFRYPYSIVKMDLNETQIIWLIDGVRNETNC